MYCKCCGSHLPDDVKICAKCGNVVANSGKAQPATLKPSKKSVSIFCCAMIFILSLGLFYSVTVRQSISEKRITAMADKIDLDGIEKVVTENSVGFIAELDAEKINRIYHETAVKKYVAGLAVEYADYMRGGKQPKGLQRHEIAEVFFDSWEKIEGIIGRKITTLELLEIKTHFDKYGDNVGIGGVFAQEFIDGIRIFTSVYTILTIILLLTVFILLLVKVRDCSPDTLLWISAPVITTAGIAGVLVVIKSVIESVITGSVGEEYKGVIRACVDNVSEITLINSGFVLLAGVALIGVYVLKKRTKKC